LRGANSQIVPRVVLVAATILVWTLTFLVVWRSTGITDRPCDDVVVVPVASACAAPGPSVLPAIPLATATAAGVAFVGSRWPRRGA
jgi:hypothetical protein